MATTADLQRLDSAHHLHPFTDHETLRREGSRIVVGGEGVWVTDTDGRRILDGMSGLWCVNVGYGREELAEAACRQMQQLAYYNSFFKTTTAPTVQLAAHLIALAPPGFSDVMFASSGSEANDTAIRMIRHFWALQGKPEKQVIISRHGAYHGSTIAGASMGGMPAMHGQLHVKLGGFHHVMPPYAFEYAEPGEDEHDFGLRAARAIEEAILEIGPDRVAAVVGEPVMGAGGVRIPPSSYWPAVEAICRHHDVLLHADEVITGFGRLGHWFGCEALGFTPDVITCAKAITSGYQPLSAVLINKRVAEGLMQGGEFFHGYTHSGHPVACAVALANLDILEREGLVERVRDHIGPYFTQQLRTLADHPLIGEVRSFGLIGALELVADKATRRRFAAEAAVGIRCRDLCFAHDFVMRAVGDTMVLAPPLVISEAEVDELIRRIGSVLDRLHEELQAPPVALPLAGSLTR
ncbi:MAG: aspartate aminotransferase family protein [Geminicoccaceae bacterium]|nr:MAG: aspartate aminotransferase family protein [Geminicoccaceae bacterium]